MGYIIYTARESVANVAFHSDCQESGVTDVDELLSFRRGGDAQPTETDAGEAEALGAL